MKLRTFWSVGGGERAPWIRHWRRGHEHLSLGQKPIIWQVFCQKSHNNEKNWDQEGAHISDAPSRIHQCFVERVLKERVTICNLV